MLLQQFWINNMRNEAVEHQNVFSWKYIFIVCIKKLYMDFSGFDPKKLTENWYVAKQRKINKQSNKQICLTIGNNRMFWSDMFGHRFNQIKSFNDSYTHRYKREKDLVTSLSLSISDFRGEALQMQINKQRDMLITRKNSKQMNSIHRIWYCK